MTGGMDDLVELLIRIVIPWDKTKQLQHESCHNICQKEKALYTQELSN
jgi:hypothetical protein